MHIWKLSLAAAALALVPACRNSLEPSPPADWPPLIGKPTSFTDEGPIDQNTVLRGLLAFNITNRSALVEATTAMYTTTDPTYRQYLTTAEFDAKYGPSQADVDQTTAWLMTNGLTVERTSTRRLLIEFSGTAEVIDAAFGFVIHTFHRTAAMPSDTSDDTYTAVPLQTPPPSGLPSSLAGIVGFSPPFPLSPGPEHVPTLQTALPTMPATAVSPPDVAGFYGFDKAAAAGMNGSGAKLGVVTGYAYHDADAAGFWDGWKIDRDPATDKSAIGDDPITTFGDEATTDVQWCGAMAPGADLVVYEMPDAAIISTLYALHEAIGRNEVDVVNDSFAHGETYAPLTLSNSFDDAGLMAAALGISVITASGDSANVDLPGASPWITSVGGTIVQQDATSGAITAEHGWANSGCGSSNTFDRPSWQPAALTPGDTGREVCDVSMQAATFTWAVDKGVWEHFGGTSVSAPMFAATIAIADGVRAAAGKPRLGWLNKRLYESTDIQAAFNDQTMSDNKMYPGAVGWDCSTGWGTANVPKVIAADW